MAQVIEGDLNTQMPDGVTLHAPAPVVSYFYAGRLFALIKWWLEQGMPLAPQEMAALTNRLCTRGVLGSVEVNMGV
jgi:hypothetical protein